VQVTKGMKARMPPQGEEIPALAGNFFPGNNTGLWGKFAWRAFSPALISRPSLCRMVFFSSKLVRWKYFCPHFSVVHLSLYADFLLSFCTPTRFLSSQHAFHCFLPFSLILTKQLFFPLPHLSRLAVEWSDGGEWRPPVPLPFWWLMS